MSSDDLMINNGVLTVSLTFMWQINIKILHIYRKELKMKKAADTHWFEYLQLAD